MLERLTGRARQAIGLAQTEAAAMGWGMTDAPHLLLGLLRLEDGVAAEALEVLGVEIEEARKVVLGVTGRGGPPTRGLLTPAASAILEAAAEEAAFGPGVWRNDPQASARAPIGAEHLLLALAAASRNGDSDIGTVFGRLTGLAAGETRVRSVVLEAIAAHDPVVQRRKAFEAILDAAAGLLKALVAEGFPATVTAYSPTHRHPDTIRPAPDVPSAAWVSWAARVNVAYSKLTVEEVTKLAEIGAAAGWSLELSQEHGPTFRPVVDDRGKVIVLSPSEASATLV